MNKKIPCGGFYLNDTLGVDENGKLGVNGGEPYKSLVTDGTGGVKWEDRLAYEGSRLVVDAGRGALFIKVSDEVPSWVSVDAPMGVWKNFKDGGTVYEVINAEDFELLGDGSFFNNAGIFAMTDNLEFDTLVFLEKGVYFFSTPDFYVSGIASADSDTPEITWDGNIGVIKKLDEKFLPEPLILYVH